LVSAIKTSTASRIAGGLLAVIGLLGILILVLDGILWKTAPAHAYALVVFVIIDFGTGAFVLAKPSRMAFTLAVAWSAVRIAIQVGDVFLGPAVGMTAVDFAGYLFNPVATNPPNPTGVPGALIDLIIILQIIAIWSAWKGRSFIRNP
jgi:hypothetical protein